MASTMCLPTNWVPPRIKTFMREFRTGDTENERRTIVSASRRLKNTISRIRRFAASSASASSAVAVASAASAHDVLQSVDVDRLDEVVMKAGFS